MSEESYKNIERRVDAQLAKANREKMTTLIGYTVVVIIIVGYMLFLRSQTAIFTPDEVVNVAISTAESKIPEAKKAVREQLVAPADDIVNKQVDKLIKIIPEQRRELEKFAKVTLTENLTMAHEAFGELFTNTMTASRADLEPMIDHLESAKSVEDFEEAFYLALKEQMTEPSLLADIADYGGILENVADIVAYLRANEGLTPAEKIELDLLVALRSVALRAEEHDISITPNP